MAKLIVIVGLPGSGKTTMINERINSIAGACVDDYMKDSKNHSKQLTDSQHYLKVIRNLREGKDCLIADIIFCDTSYRIELEQILRREVPDVKIEWQFFENAPEECKVNSLRRKREILQQELQNIDYLSAKYHIPAGIKVMKVYSEKSTTSYKEMKYIKSEK